MLNNVRVRPCLVNFKGVERK